VSKKYNELLSELAKKFEILSGELDQKTKLTIQPLDTKSKIELPTDTKTSSVKSSPNIESPDNTLNIDRLIDSINVTIGVNKQSNLEIPLEKINKKENISDLISILNIINNIKKQSKKTITSDQIKKFQKQKEEINDILLQIQSMKINTIDELLETYEQVTLAYEKMYTEEDLLSLSKDELIKYQKKFTCHQRKNEYT